MKLVLIEQEQKTYDLLKKLRIATCSEQPRIANTTCDLDHGAGWAILNHATTYLGLNEYNSEYHTSEEDMKQSRKYVHGCVALAVQYPNLKAPKPYKTCKLCRANQTSKENI